MTSRNCHNDEIILDTAVINKTAYNFIWFNGAKTEYAEVTYTVDNKPLDILNIRYIRYGYYLLQSAV